MKNKGIATSVIVIVVVVAATAAGGYMVMSGDGDNPLTTDENEGGTGGGGETEVSPNATVKLHDATTIDLSKQAENYIQSDMSGVDINVSGTVTVNSFSATNVELKLHNQDSDNWTTIVNEENITDLTTVNEFSKEISSGTYDKVSVYIGTITVDIQWTEIKINGSGFGTENIVYTVPSDNFYESATIKEEFTINLSTGVSVTSGENKTFDIDTGAPFNLPISGDSLDLSSDGPETGLDKDRMQAKTVVETTSETDEGTDDTSTGGEDYSGTWTSDDGNFEGNWEFTVDDDGNVTGSTSGDVKTSLSGSVTEGNIEAEGTAAGGTVTWSGNISSDGSASGTWKLPAKNLTGTWEGEKSS